MSINPRGRAFWNTFQALKLILQANVWVKIGLLTTLLLNLCPGITQRYGAIKYRLTIGGFYPIQAEIALPFKLELLTGTGIGQLGLKLAAGQRGQ